MSNPIESIVEKFSKKSEFSHSLRDGVHLLAISKGDSLSVEIAVVPDYPEWEVSIRDRSSNEWLISEFHHYIPANDLTLKEAQLEIEEAANDLNGFLHRLSTLDVRVRERNTFFTKHLVFESLENGNWRFEFNNALAKWNNPEKDKEQVYK